MKAVAIGCSVILVLGLVGVIALFVFVFSVIKRSDVYRQAFTRATTDPRVVEVLGTPIEKGWWVMGSVNINNDTGNANIDFPISGPKGSARVHATASYDGNAWTYSSLIVRPASGSEIDILHPTASSAKARIVLPKLADLLISNELKPFSLSENPFIRVWVSGC